MADKSDREKDHLSFKVSVQQRPEFDHPLTGYAFDRQNALIATADIRDGTLDLAVPKGDRHAVRVLIAPRLPAWDREPPTPDALLRHGAYEPVLRIGNEMIRHIDIPGAILDRWPFCFCWVRGRVLRSADNRPVCNARVHICEVDRLPWLIARLPDPDIVRLRDDLLEVYRKPPIPDPPPFRVPPVRVPPGPDPFPPPLPRGALRFGAAAGMGAGTRFAGASSADIAALNPQPLPPRWDDATPPALDMMLHSRSAVVLRRALVDNWQRLVPWLCLWQHRWWWFTCDEVSVVTTDPQGRFEATILYACGGDRPDVYVWVEYDFGNGFETVHKPSLACHTHWNHACGTEIVVRVTDPRVPGCGEEPDLPGRQVVVLSIGRDIAVREIQTAGARGLTTAGEPFGQTLEPRVDFSRSALIAAGIPYYRWSVRRLSGPDGVSGTAPAGSVPIGGWSPLIRDVYRHYRVGTGFPSDAMGPMPTAGPGAAPVPNLFRIRPVLPPAGTEWVVLDESIDLATAYFDTASLAGAPVGPSTDDLAAGLYEMKLELFDTAGALVNWTAAGIDLRITDQVAPFGSGAITTSAASGDNRILAGSDTMGFRMVVRVDNSRCSADILPVGGGVTPDPLCGFHSYALGTDVATLSFVARHPNRFATYSFAVTRGADPGLLVATGGTAGEAGAAPFSQTGGFTYSSGGTVTVSALLGPCPNAALAERLHVWAMATNGYGRLSAYDAADNAAFALAQPCACPPGTP